MLAKKRETSAKARTGRAAGRPKPAAASAEPGPVEPKVIVLAENLGRFLGSAQAKATSLIGKRQEVARQLVQIRDAANDALSALGHQVQHGYQALSATVAVGRRRVARPAKKRARKPAKGTPAPPGTGTTVRRRGAAAEANAQVRGSLQPKAAAVRSRTTGQRGRG